MQIVKKKQGSHEREGLNYGSIVKRLPKIFKIGVFYCWWCEKPQYLQMQQISEQIKVYNSLHNDNHDIKLETAKIRVKKLRTVFNVVTRCQILILNLRGAIKKGSTWMLCLQMTKPTHCDYLREDQYLRLYFLITSLKLLPQQQISIKYSIFNIHRQQQTWIIHFRECCCLISTSTQECLIPKRIYE